MEIYVYVGSACALVYWKTSNALITQLHLLLLLPVDSRPSHENCEVCQLHSKKKKFFLLYSSTLVFKHHCAYSRSFPHDLSGYPVIR